ncbi:hypothetical protein SAMN05428969_2840 [Devosia sp. YR412]|uniref:hypothetical protein n=1 Tax=Devosia sp. YR412 TaxID=1881030 RepID=UPI0008D0EE8D|nr:hypothetical protein [Devosia sp. YR412]SEQ38126.1 hypothetical protein SAMN05428969_2840 [Devosia sp. YR412]
MNRLLADTLGVLNGVLAIVIILGGAVVGMGSTLGAGNRIVGLAIGSVAGFFIAGGLCGLIAFLVLIESHLRDIADATTQSGARD